MNQPATILLLAGALLGAPFLPSSASACSGVACDAPQLIAGTALVIPANAPGLAIERIWLEEDTEAFAAELFDVTSGEAVPVEVEIIDGLVVPLDGFVAGASYELSLSSVCGETPLASHATIEVTEAAPLPDTLGWVQNGITEYEGEVPVPDTGGACFGTVAASYADVNVQLDPIVEPWAQLLVWETIVDGVPYAPTGSYSPRNGYGLPTGYQSDPAGSWVGRGRDRIYTACGGFTSSTFDEGVEGGGHDVVFRAHIPGTETVLETTGGYVQVQCFVGHGYGPCAGGEPLDPYTGDCWTPTDEPCDPYYTSESWYDSACGDSGYYDDEPGGMFLCSATGAPASRGGAFGFGFLMLGALVAFRARRRRG